MHGALVADHRVGPGARARDHHVVAGQVERLDGGRVERQEGAEVARRGAHPLKERGVDVAVREAGLGAALVVDGREHVGLRPEVAHLQEHAVRAPHADQEVVDQCRAWLGPPCRPSNAHGRAVYAGRAPTLGFAAMPRIVALLLAVSLLALPAAAMAQSAGDEQYADPFGQTDEPSGSQGEPARARAGRRPRSGHPGRTRGAGGDLAAGRRAHASGHGPPRVPAGECRGDAARKRRRAAPARVLTAAPVAINARAAVRREIGGVERWARELSNRLPRSARPLHRDPAAGQARARGRTGVGAGGAAAGRTRIGAAALARRTWRRSRAAATCVVIHDAGPVSASPTGSGAHTAPGIAR